MGKTVKSVDDVKHWYIGHRVVDLVKLEITLKRHEIGKIVKRAGFAKQKKYIGEIGAIGTGWIFVGI